MKKILHNLFGAKSALWATALMLLAAACTRDAETETGWQIPEGDAAIHLQLAVPQADGRTRAQQSITDTTIETLWVGLFETSSTNNIDSNAKLVKTWVMENVPLDGTSSNLTLNVPASDGVLANPGSRFHLSAVANYKNIVGRLNGNDDNLIEILRNVETWGEYCSIAIDTESAAAQLYPVMQGALLSQNSAAAQMIYPETYGFYNPADVTHTYNAATLLGYEHPTDQKIYLRRLIASVTVNVTPDFSADRVDDEEYDKVTVNNLRYAVVNCPKSVYLQERIVPEDPKNVRSLPANLFASDAYKTYSPNYGDWEADGFFNTVDEAEFVSVPGEYIHTKGGKEAVSMTFQYNRFENKHTGIATNLSDYYDREAVSNGVFTALCPEGSTYNNFAPYFILVADMLLEKTGEKPLNVTARYTIHEGYSNGPEANQLDSRNTQSGTPNYATRLRDFSCVRNTNYTYNLKIKGANNILVQVVADKSGDYGTYNRNGVSGDVSEVVDFVELGPDGKDADGSAEWKIELTNAERSKIAKNWLFVTPYRAKLPSGEWVYEPVEFGYNTVAVPALSSVNGGGRFYSADTYTDFANNQFYNWVHFYDEKGADLGGIAEFAASAPDANAATKKSYTVKVSGDIYYNHSYGQLFDDTSLSLTGDSQESYLNPSQDSRALYFCIADPVEGTDGVSTYQKVLFLTQKMRDDRTQLETPTILSWSDPMFSASAANVSWSPVTNAYTYRVTYEGTETEQSDTNYAFYTPSLAYGDLMDFAVSAYPENEAEYLPSDPAVQPLMLFTQHQLWTLSSLPGLGSLPAVDTTFDDWQELGNTMAVKGTVKNNSTELQLSAAGQENAQLKILVPASGSLRVAFSDTGGTEGSSTRSPRYLETQVNGRSYRSTVSSNSTAQKNTSLNVLVEEPTEVYIYSNALNQGGLRIYNVEYTVGAYVPTVWDNSSVAWQYYLTNLPSDNSLTNYDMSLNGLFLHTSNTVLKTADNGNCIQLGAGGVDKQYIGFLATSSGTLTLTVAGTGADAKNDGRGIYVQTGYDSSNQEFQECDPRSTDRVTVKFDITVPEGPAGTLVYIWSSNGNRYYSISYTGAVRLQ